MQSFEKENENTYFYKAYSEKESAASKVYYLNYSKNNFIIKKIKTANINNMIMTLRLDCVVRVTSKAKPSQFQWLPASPGVWNKSKA